MVFRSLTSAAMRFADFTGEKTISRGLLTSKLWAYSAKDNNPMDPENKRWVNADAKLKNPRRRTLSGLHRVQDLSNHLLRWTASSEERRRKSERERGEGGTR